jgi:tRNA threonylcarbamoyladenosine biosynthesis protein TsaB
MRDPSAKAKPPLILACDTTQGACSLALWRGDLVASRLTPMQKGHAEALMPMMEELCAEAAIDLRAITHLAVTHGPGTFTGVRVGLSAMRGLALALDAPLKTYGTLAVMAAACPQELPLIVAIDAKRETFYTQSFAAKGAPLTAPQALSAPDILAMAQSLTRPEGEKKGSQKIALCGSGTPLLVEACELSDAAGLFHVLDAPPYPQAAHLARLAAEDAGLPEKWENLPPAEPLYLRPPDATLPDPSKNIKWRV